MAHREWTRQAYVYLNKLNGKSEFLLPYRIQPLNVIKQVIAMSLALLREDRVDHYEEWRRFVLNREEKYLSPTVRVYAYPYVP
jgi:hypothetical protein